MPHNTQVYESILADFLSGRKADLSWIDKTELKDMCDLYWCKVRTEFFTYVFRGIILPIVEHGSIPEQKELDAFLKSYSEIYNKRKEIDNQIQRLT